MNKRIYRYISLQIPIEQLFIDAGFDQPEIHEQKQAVESLTQFLHDTLDEHWQDVLTYNTDVQLLKNDR